MTRTAPIVLCGFMASGKTTVAHALADLLHCRMADLDRNLIEREGRSIASMIRELGEQTFREKEAAALRGLFDICSIGIIALGGGAWAVAENRALIAERGCLSVWLDAPFEVCWQRMVASGNERPLARSYAHSRELYNERCSSYALADVRVEIFEDKCVDAIANEILALYPSQQFGQSILRHEYSARH